MANPKIQLKRGSSTGTSIQNAQLSPGELFVDQAHNRLYVNNGTSDANIFNCQIIPSVNYLENAEMTINEQWNFGANLRINGSMYGNGNVQIISSGSTYTSLGATSRTTNIRGTQVNITGDLVVTNNASFQEDIRMQGGGIYTNTLNTQAPSGAIAKRMLYSNNDNTYIRLGDESVPTYLYGSALYDYTSGSALRVINETTVKNLGPDYANAVNMGFTQLSGTTPQTYTAPSSGYAIIYASIGRGGSLRVEINETVYFVGAPAQTFSHTIPLSTGDILKVYQDAETTTSWNFGVAKFVPLKLNT